MPRTSHRVVECIIAQGRDQAREEPVGKASQCTFVTETAGTHRSVERTTGALPRALDRAQ